MPTTGGTDDTATAALGLPGFVVAAAGAYGGELELLVETTESVTGCPRCGVLATLHDRKPRSVRDLPSGGRPVILVWFKRIWRCQEPRCPQRTWSETSPGIRPRAVLTERARAECARRVGQDATDVARVAADLGVGWGTAMRAVREYGQRILNQQWLHTNVSVLGLDETAFLAATATSPTRLVRHWLGRPATRGRRAGSAARHRLRPLRPGGVGLARRPWTGLVRPGAGRRARPRSATEGCTTRSRPAPTRIWL